MKITGRKTAGGTNLAAGPLYFRQQDWPVVPAAGSPALHIVFVAAINPINLDARPGLPARAQGRLAPLVQVASLFATGWMVWLNTISPRLHRYSWATLIGSALGYTVFACAASAAITIGLLLAIRRERGEIVWGTLRTSAAGAWFAPAIILLSQFSPASLTAALVLVVTTTRLLYSEWRRLYPPEEPLPVWVPADPMFGEADPPPPFFLKDLAPSLAVALATQASVTAFAMHARLLGGALFAMSAAMVTVFAISAGVGESRRVENLPRSILSLVLTILLASGLTVGGLRGGVVRRGGLSAGAGGGAASEPGPGEPGPAKDPAATPGGQPSAPPGSLSPALAAASADGSYPGVILQPEPLKVPRLVDPVLEFGEGRHYPGYKREIAIAFEGEYWMYRFLYRRPPPNSYLRKGTPAEMSFHTPDHWPLIMEAHQKLDQAIDLRCCRTVQVRLWNADEYPGTVSLELLAIETRGLSRSLGSAPVQSVPDLTKQPVTAVAETLEFTVPPHPDPASYNELEVVFRRSNTRIDKSARIAIDRFVLVPK